MCSTKKKELGIKLDHLLEVYMNNQLVWLS